LRYQAKLEQAKLAAKVMNVATPGTSFSGETAELHGSNTQTELKAMQKGLGKCVCMCVCVNVYVCMCVCVDVCE